MGINLYSLLYPKKKICYRLRKPLEKLVYFDLQKNVRLMSELSKNVGCVVEKKIIVYNEK